MAYILELLIILAFPFAVHWFIQRRRRGKVVDSGTVQIRRDSESNTYKCTALINGRKVEGILDTGASITTIGIDEAEKLGIDISTLYFDKNIDTAAGTKHAAMAEINVATFQIGPIAIKNLGIGVNRFMDKKCLVGMNFFESLDSFQIEGNVLTLRKDPDRETFDGTATEPQPSKAAAAAAGRVPAVCPYCDISMTLPAGRSGDVKCHSCNRSFFADTSANENGKAVCRPIP
jgi:clan AA aspartic protease (TIGR02281 family)